jgi:hypothetical protein
VREKLNEKNVNCAVSGTGVMITFSCDFCRFSAKKMAFFSKTDVMINFLQNLAVD